MFSHRTFRHRKAFLSECNFIHALQVLNLLDLLIVSVHLIIINVLKYFLIFSSVNCRHDFFFLDVVHQLTAHVLSAYYFFL